MTARVLLIDDDRNILEGYQRCLRRHFAIETAEGPRAGLNKILSEEPYCVVVADMLMPGITGLEVLRKLKEFSPNSVGLLFTGVQDAVLALEALNEGVAYRFLQKPASTERLIRGIRECLDYHRLLAGQSLQLQDTLHPLLLAISDQVSEFQMAVHGRTFSLARLMRKLAEHLKLPHPEDFEMAGALAGLAWCSAPRQVQNKLFGQGATDETVGLTLLNHEISLSKQLMEIAALSEILEFLKSPLRPWAQSVPAANLLSCPRVAVGGHLLGCVREFALVYLHTNSHSSAMSRVSGRRDYYHVQLLQALSQVGQSIPASC